MTKNAPELITDRLRGLLNEGSDPTSAPTPELDEDGGMTIEISDEDMEGISDEETAGEFSEEAHMENLIDRIGEAEQERIANLVVDGYEADLRSREEWMSTLIKGMEMLGTKIQDGDLFEGSCGVNHPLITEAAIKFQQKATNEILPANGPVRTEVLGTPTPEAEAQAERVKDHMNYQVTTEMPDYYSEAERMLFYLPLIGSGFKKMYYSARYKRPDTNFIPVDQFVVPYGAKSLEKAPRHTEVIYYSESDFKREVASGLYRKVDLGEPGQVKPTEFQEKQDQLIGISPAYSMYDRVYTVLEQHVELSIEGLDEEPDHDKPYIVTVDLNTRKILSIYRNWEYGDDTYTKRMWYVHYPFVPGLGFYGLGYIHLLGNLAATLTAALRALIDAGQFANLPAGLVTKGVRIKDEQGPIAPGEFREVEGAIDDIAKAFMPLPFKGPNVTLFELVKYLEERALKFADSTEQVVADAANYGPVGTTMALLDASTKFFTAIHKRLHFSQKKEFLILASLNRDYLDEKYTYNIPGQTLYVMREDYDDRVNIQPVSDPNISSNAQRLALAQAKLQFLQSLPNELGVRINRMPIIKSILVGMGETKVDEIIQAEPEPQPQDPFSDIMSVTQGQPIKAFPGQNHDAHVMFKMGWLQDPTQGASPMFQMFAPQIQANIREHQLLKFQESMQGVMQQAGLTGAATDPKTLEMVVAQAGQQVMAANAQMQVQGMMNTPEGVLAQAEMKKAENQSKQIAANMIKDSAELAIKQKELELAAAKELNRKSESQTKLVADMKNKQADRGMKIVNESVKRLNEAARERAKASFMTDENGKTDEE